MKRRLQNKIAESTWTLPVVALFVALWWLLPFDRRWEEPAGLAVCIITTYVLMEMNSANALLRVRSRMVSAVFLLLMCALPWLHPFSWTAVATCCMSLSFHQLLLTYDRHEPVVPTFHAYLFVGLASLVWPPLLWLALVQWWSQTVFLRSMSWRCLWAAVLGLVLPYFFWGSWALVAHYATIPGMPVPAASIGPHLWGAVAPLWQVVATARAGQVPLADVWLGLNQELVDADRDIRAVYSAHTPWLIAHVRPLAATAFVGLLSLTGFVHYLRKNYDDKIRVRMCHYTFLLMEAVVVVWMLLMPAAWHWLFPLLVMLICPSVAHLFALTRTWLTNAWFVLSFLLWLTLLLIPC
ncbi:MAG: hypothetical protein IKO12_07715 [Bacteroidaceae bacterium]|nr:hypothetical protein [Bacteroidaceae bacterium]